MRPTTSPGSYALRSATVTTRSRLLILIVIAVAWFVLAIVNVAHSRYAVGIVYAVCGIVISAMTLRLSKGRRAR